MKIDRDAFYTDTLLQLGHISAEISHLLNFFGKINPDVIQEVKAQIATATRQHQPTTQAQLSRLRLCRFYPQT